MKRFFLLIFALFIGFSAVSQGKNFELSVKVDGYPKGQKLSLGRYYADKQYYVDSAFYDSKKDAYVFKRDTLLEGGMYLLITFENAFAEIIIDKNQQFSIEMKYPEFGADMKFQNSEENQLYQDLNTKIRPYYIEYEALRKEHDSLADKESPEAKALIEKIKTTFESVENTKKQFMETHPKHLMTAVFNAQKEVEIPSVPETISDERDKQYWRYNYFKEHYFDNIDLLDDRLLRTPIFHQRVETYIERLLPHPDSIKFALENVIEKARGNKEMFKYLVWFTVDKYQRSQIIGYDAIWVYLAEKYYLTGDAYWASTAVVESFRKRITSLKPLLIGNKPVEFVCPDTNADTPDEKLISVFSPKTRYTVVIFWTTDCGHCKKQMPLLRDFYNEKRKELDFEVYAVCRDHDVTRWKNYIHSNNITHWINVNGKSSNVKYDELWDVSSTPTIYVLDSQKRIVTKRIEADQIEPFIRNWNAIYYSDTKN